MSNHGKCLHNLPSQRLMLETLDKLKIQNKIKIELCTYKYNVLKKLTLELKTMRSW